MNFTVFCNNTARFIIQNLNVTKFQKFPAKWDMYKFKLSGMGKGNLAASEMLECRHNHYKYNQNYNEHENTHNNDDNKNNADDGKQKCRWNNHLGTTTIVSAAFSFNFFGKNASNNDDEETPEEKLITAIKRSVLCIQREQYDKAEQMLHLALRMAQDMQSKDGITYVFDLMANMAMDRGQYKKAEKLFADVMKRLMTDGHTEESPQILHISSKIAHMSQMQGELEKSLQGFTWTLKKIEDILRKSPGDKEIQELYGLTRNWFGQLQIKLGKYADAKKSFESAFETLTEIYGRANEEAITILNNLSVACVNLEDFDSAKKYLLEAIDLVNELKDSVQEGLLHANLGLIYLREGLVQQAKESCALAWRVAKKSGNNDAMEQAEYCFNEIKTYTANA